MTERRLAQDPTPPTRLLRLPEVQARTGLSRSTIYVRVDQGRFPRPVLLGARAVGWIESEIEAWLRQRDRTVPGPGDGPATHPTPHQRRRDDENVV